MMDSFKVHLVGVGVAILLASGAHAQAEATSCAIRGRLIDSVRVQDRAARELIETAAREAGVDSLRGLVYVAPGQGARVLAGNLPAEALAGISTRLLDLALETQTRRNPRPTLLVRLDPLPLPPCVRGRRHETVPALVNRPQVVRMLSTLLTQTSSDLIGREDLLRMVLTREGEVAAADVFTSSAPMSREEGVLELVRRMRFRSAMLDGVPVDVVVVLPITLMGEPMGPPPGTPRS